MQAISELKDKTIRLLTGAYCLFFFSLRLLIPHSLRNDEAEQVLAASSFELGYIKQPPLYSWIGYTLANIFNSGDLNIYLILTIKYLCYFAFLFFTYKLAKQIFKSQQIAYLCLLSQLLFVTYSYDFTRDLSHTILVTVFSVLSLLVYLKLWAKQSTLNYINLGLVFGLGFMSKYNFLFTALALVIASFTHRHAFKILFNFKTLISFLTCALVGSPHLYYLYQKNYSGIEYALERSNKIVEKSYSFLELLIKKVSTLALTYYEIILVVTLLSLLFIAFNKKYTNTESIKLPNYNFKKFFINFSLIALCIPFLMVIFLGFNQFFAKWLSPVAFLTPIIFFIYFKEPIQKLKVTILEFIISIIVIAISSVYILGGFFPDLVGRISQTQYPYKDLCKQIYKLKSAQFRSSPITIITQNNEVLEANLKLACKEAEIYSIYKIKDTQSKKFSEDSSIIIFSNKKKREKFIQRMNKNSKVIPENLATLQAKYINSEKQFYKVYVIY
ncbi:MAG: glycosyltransferase family 39 protein [Candidatus Caenarcaniphilales bacterium]|nr:glycosyltransferase family 39 protein [Candidatus Caenarcaniphilales bacterium]